MILYWTGKNPMKGPSNDTFLDRLESKERTEQLYFTGQVGIQGKDRAMIFYWTGWNPRTGPSNDTLLDRLESKERTEQ